MSAVSLCGQSDFARALLDPEVGCLIGLSTWNGSDPSARLAVYRNNVISSLIDAVADTFPVVQELVGEPFFRAMASVYVRRSPPRSRVLAHYGETFPDFIKGFEPARSVPCLADMARLELARVRACHAADVEVVASGSVALALASGERIGELSLLCHPSVSLVRSAFAVVSLWAAHQDSGDFSAIDTNDGEDALVLRQGLDVLVLHVPAGAAAFVTALLQRRCLGDAAGLATNADLGFDLSATLALLMGHGALTSIHLPEGPPS